MEVYVDDMLVKSQTAGDHLENLALMFGILKDYQMRLNPTKCAFGVSSGKFLGFMISQRGIEANPEKIKAIIDMETSKTQKDIQSLTGRVAALTRFISKATDKCVPFFKALKGGKHHITWTPECDQAFQNLKNYMSQAPLLSKPLPGEEAGEGGATDLLCQQSAPERRALLPTLGAASTGPGRLGAKTSPLLPGSRDHSSDEPASSAGAPEAGNIWPIGQAVADFISELTPPALSEPSSPSAIPLAPEKVDTERFNTFVPLWILHVDGSANQQGCGTGLVLTTPDGNKIEYALRFNFRTSNNEAEYEALLAGLRLAQSMSARQISIHSDS
ncbi:unnamed protein product [Prunus armeniaca]